MSTQPQNFKGDALELKMRACAEPALVLTETALDEFYAGGFEATDFLLMLYDEGRMPFSQRVKRAAFVQFIKKALENFPFIGNFESYLFILKEIFGSESEIRFYVTDPGKLAIEVDASASILFDFIAREYSDGAYTFFDITDSVGDSIVFRGVAGIETEYELSLLFAEIMPAGIVPDITLGFFVISDFVDDDDNFIVDDIDNGIIFDEGDA